MSTHHRLEPFEDRRAGGGALASALARYRGEPDLLVLGLPRGGVPVAAVVAEALDAELDVLVVRKLGVPWHPELAMGAIASGDATVLSDEVIEGSGVSRPQVQQVLEREREELARRERRYREGRPFPEVEGRTVIVVDDGIATGSTMKAAVRALRQLGAGRVVVAVPVAPAQALHDFEGLADDFVCVQAPEHFYAVGAWYLRFGQTQDEEVRSLLRSRNDDPGVARP